MSNNQPTKNDAPKRSRNTDAFDYSHLRETQNNSHWYASPQDQSKDNTPNKTEASPAPTQPTIPVDNGYPEEQKDSNPPPSSLTAPTIPSAQAPVRVSSVAAPSSVPPSAPNSAISAPIHAPVSLPRRRAYRRRRKTSMSQNWAWAVIAAALLGITIVGSMLLIFVVRYAVRGDDNQSLAQQPQIEPTSIIYADESGGGALEGNSLEIQNNKWDGQERFTILLMGLDKRPDESGSVFRTDSMMLISLDPTTNSIGILSIPRDLYVEVPFYGLHRVNAAYVLGELEEPGGGPTLAKQTAQYNFGIAVNEYVTVDFNAVIAIIDAIGGIEVEVERDIVDYAYPTMDYGTEVFRLSAGWQTLDGSTALKYARTRHASDDIDRAQRQQDVIYAVRDKVTSLDMVDDLVKEAPFIYGEINNGIDTGLSFDQLIQLFLWAAEVPRENIKSGVVSWEYLFGYQTESGASVLVPNRSVIGGLMVEVFGENYAE